MEATKETVWGCEGRVPLWLSRLQTQLVSMRMQVWSLASLSELRIWHCQEMQCLVLPWLWLQLQFNPSLGTSICPRCSPKKAKKKKERKKKRWSRELYTHTHVRARAHCIYILFDFREKFSLTYSYLYVYWYLGAVITITTFFLGD